MSEKKDSLFSIFTNGLWRESPTFRMLLGMCPALAVSNSATNGVAMGLATTFVLISSAVLVSSSRKIIPNQVRIAAYIVIIATFVTMADYFLKAFFPVQSKTLGPFVPLIVVNCIILGRAEAFSSKNKLLPSILDSLGMGLGFTFALTAIGIIRELLGAGSIFEVRLLADKAWFEPWIIMLLPAGAFLTLGIMIGVINTFTMKKTAAGVNFGDNIGYIENSRLIAAENRFLTPEEIKAAREKKPKKK